MLIRARCLIAGSSSFHQLCQPRPLAGSGFRRNSSTTSSDVLRILFCGSDQFSITSLTALYDYAQTPGSNIASIDVACKTDKRTGRGLKVVKPPPIKPIALSLGLPVHQFDTFRGWELPISGASPSSHINMVIAVSFGLLVPPRILNACQFGGLNAHPSMLPHLKGSSPVEHAIINGERTTGVTIQTLHPSKFDEGQIVLQTPTPGIEIPRPDEITSLELKAVLAELGAKMLVQVLKERLFLSHNNLQIEAASIPPSVIKQAPKINQETRHVDFRNSTSTDILRLKRALGRLWAEVPQHVLQPTRRKWLDSGRIIFPKHSRFTVADKADMEELIDQSQFNSIQFGVPFAITSTDVATSKVPEMLYVKVADDKYLKISDMGVSGMIYGNAGEVANNAGFFAQRNLSDSKRTILHTFAGPLY